MRMYRIITAAVFFFVFGVGGFIIGAIIFPFLCLFLPKEKQRLHFSGLVHYSWKIFIKLMCVLKIIKLEIYNKERLSDLSRHIVVSNHPSLIDIVILISLIPHAICIVKGGLSKNIFMKKIIQRLYLVNDLEPVDLIKKAHKALDEGFNVIIFPEGTRTDFMKKEVKLHRGFAHLAIDAATPVLPIKISSSPRILGKKQKWYDLGEETTVYKLEILAPIIPYKPENLSDYSLSLKLTDCVKHKIFDDILE